MSLSRLEAGSKDDSKRQGINLLLIGFFTENLHYASTYAEEHQENFKEMLFKMMEEETLQKLIENTKGLCLQLNLKKGWVPREYNKKVIEPAYGTRLFSVLSRPLFFVLFSPFLLVTKSKTFSFVTSPHNRKT